MLLDHIESCVKIAKILRVHVGIDHDYSFTMAVSLMRTCRSYSKVNWLISFVARTLVVNVVLVVLQHHIHLYY